MLFFPRPLTLSSPKALWLGLHKRYIWPKLQPYEHNIVMILINVTASKKQKNGGYEAQPYYKVKALAGWAGSSAHPLID